MTLVRADPSLSVSLADHCEDEDDNDDDGDGGDVDNLENGDDDNLKATPSQINQVQLGDNNGYVDDGNIDD